MTRGVGPHRPVPRVEPTSPERLDAQLEGDDVVDHDVVMDLLRPGRVTPDGRLVVGRESWGVMGIEDDVVEAADRRHAAIIAPRRPSSRLTRVATLAG